MRSTSKEVKTRRELVKAELEKGLKVGEISDILGIDYNIVYHDIKTLVKHDKDNLNEGAVIVPLGYVGLESGCPPLCPQGEGLLIFYDMDKRPLIHVGSEEYTAKNEVAFMLR